MSFFRHFIKVLSGKRSRTEPGIVNDNNNNVYLDIIYRLWSFGQLSDSGKIGNEFHLS